MTGSKVDVEGVDCKITSATFYKIVCEIAAIAVPTDIAFVGSRGLRRWFWNNTAASFADLDGLVTPTTLENWLEPDGPVNL